ncbi:hypothetical protein A6R68_02977, partial [Neotoma lepida]
YNTQLSPPYHILIDTNFINFSIKAKLGLVQSMTDCLYAKCIPCITDCVMAETEKLRQKYRAPGVTDSYSKSIFLKEAVLSEPGGLLPEDALNPTVKSLATQQSHGE